MSCPAPQMNVHVPAQGRRRVLALAAVALTVLVQGPVRAEAAGVTEKFARSAAQSGATVDHGPWDRLLRAHVVPASDGVNRVDYVRLKAEGHAAIKVYIAALETVDVAKLGRAEQMAFWINLYNAKTADIVLDKYPVKSIRDISLPDATGAPGDGPWRAKVVKVSGVALSLDEIENEILRPIYKDPRVHYALNCLSIGCPNLLAEAFTGAKLDAQFDRAAKAFINHPRAISIGSDKVTASSVYEWFVSDFGGSLADVIAHMSKYAEPALKTRLTEVKKIAVYDYDWTLNDIAR